MADYSFEPDYKHWWNRVDLTESDLAWLILEISPDDARQSLALKNKPDPSEDESEWKTQFGYYLHGLFNGPWIGRDHGEILKRKLWGKGKEDFIQNAYNRTMKLPEKFSVYLDSIGIVATQFEHYKNYEQYRASLRDWKLEDIDSEDKGLSLLLGFNPEFFQRYCTLHEILRAEEDAWENFSPDDRHFERAFGSFTTSEYSLDLIQSGVLPAFRKKSKALGLWTGDFTSYVQALHNNGFVFNRRAYKGLEFHGIKPVYTHDGWARGFYRTWIERGVWRIKEAALLYLGDDPLGGRGFYGFGESGRKGPGRILQLDLSKRNSVIFLLVDENGKWVDTSCSKLEEETSVEIFIKNHVEAGNLTPASTDDGLKFKPRDIVAFFRDYFPLTYQPKALLVELGLEDEEPGSLQTPECPGGIQWVLQDAEDKAEPASLSDPLQTGFPGRPSKSKDLIRLEFERRQQCGLIAETLAEEVRILIAWLENNYPAMPVPKPKTVENSFRAIFRQYHAMKQAA